jgi:hypothetical protein
VASSKLSLYKGALLACEERAIETLTEECESRRLLDSVWNRDALRTCLQAGQWNFATRGAALEYDPSITPGFGYRRAFGKPTDFVRTTGVCSDEYFREPLTAYIDEAGHWYCDLDTLYVRYVSDDEDYGGDYTVWPPNFSRYVEHYLASMIVGKLTHSDALEAKVTRKLKHWLKEAKSTDAMEDPAVMPPAGSWSRARRGGRGGNDGGNRGSGSLIG